ncbi:MAG: STAS domain-containing protein [Turneriella sp.]|nr:STAS domain-containing protein [Turneriella sp.]
MLEFNTAFEKDILVIELEGSLDSHSAADFRSWFNEKTRGGYRAFAIDCLCLEYISSAGISALIDLQNALAGQNGKMVLYQLSSETRQLLKFLQLEKKLNLAGDYDDAIAALTGIKKIIKEEAPPIVDAGEIRVLPKAPEPEPAPQPEVATKPASDEMQVEEHFSADKKGLHPMHDERPATPAPQPQELAPAPVVSAPVAATAVAPAPVPATPVQQATAPTTPVVEAPPAPPVVEDKPSPEAQELKLNAAAKRLITCPNCKSVLRLAVAGDYLCPACRFRFTYKGNAERPAT